MHIVNKSEQKKGKQKFHFSLMCQQFEELKIAFSNETPEQLSLDQMLSEKWI